MLKQKIQEDLKEALKEKKEIEVSSLRMLISAINNKQTEKRTKLWKEKPDSPVEELEKESQLIDEEVIEAVSSEVKKRKESRNIIVHITNIEATAIFGMVLEEEVGKDHFGVAVVLVDNYEFVGLC